MIDQALVVSDPDSVATPAIDAAVEASAARPGAGRLGAARREALPIVDQGVSSGSNFLLNTMVARSSSPGEFAVFTLAASAYSVLQGAARAGLYFRLLARSDQASARAALPRVLRSVVMVTASLGVLAGVAFLTIGRSVPAALLCFFLPVVLLQDAQRFGAFVFRRDTDALRSDVAWLAVTLVLIVAAKVMLGSVSPAVATTAWVSGASVGVMVLLTRRQYVPGKRGEPIHEWTSPRAIAGGGSEFLLAASVSFGVPLLAVIGYGAHGVSALQASIQFFAPIFAFQQGMSTPFIRTLLRSDPGERRRVQFVLVAITVVVIGTAVGAMYALRATLGPFLLGRLWPTTAAFVLPAACFVVARFVELPAYGLARFGASTRRMVSLRATTSAITVGAFVVPMAMGWSLLAAFWSFAVAAVCCAFAAQTIRWEDA